MIDPLMAATFLRLLAPSPKPKAPICANGQMRYDIETGKPATASAPCTNPARYGHILCDRCRKEAGGYVRVPVASSRPI